MNKKQKFKEKERIYWIKRTLNGLDIGNKMESESFKEGDWVIIKEKKREKCEICENIGEVRKSKKLKFV